MKKFGLFLIVMLVALTGVTSCLESGGNRDTGGAVGTLEISNKSFVYVLRTLTGDIYAPELSSYISSGKMRQGGNYYMNYEIDFDLPENTTAMVAANGYYTVTILSYAEAEDSYLNYYLTDTSTVQPDEIVVSQPTMTYQEGGVFGFSEDHIFMTPVVKRQEDLKLRWDLSYDYETMMPTEENGKRYYDLFLRATKMNSSDKTTTTEFMSLIAYNVNSYLKNVASKEKELLGSSYNQTSTFTLRINYVSEIKDNDELVWKSKEIASPIVLFESSSE